MSKHAITPEIACTILRRMGLISNHDNGYFESALLSYEIHGDAVKAAHDAAETRADDIERGYDDDYTH